MTTSFIIHYLGWQAVASWGQMFEFGRFAQWTAWRLISPNAIGSMSESPTRTKPLARQTLRVPTRRLLCKSGKRLHGRGKPG
jgi:hypothetical protein